jgi:hypothetical protein
MDENSSLEVELLIESHFMDENSRLEVGLLIQSLHHTADVTQVSSFTLLLCVLTVVLLVLLCCRGEEWSYLRGGLTTLDRDYGIFNKIHHDIGTHVVHHLVSWELRRQQQQSL